MPLTDNFAATFFVRRTYAGGWMISADVVHGSPAGEYVVRRVQVDPKTGEGAAGRALYEARAICRDLLLREEAEGP